MVQAVSAEQAKQNRVYVLSPTGDMIWRTDFIGDRANKVEGQPHAFLAEQIAGGTIGAHYHHVDQFQVFSAGHGTLGRHPVSLIALHYVDHHTAYGPIHAGPQGLSLFTIRAQFDKFPVFLDRPGYKDHLQPSKKRYLMADGIVLSTEPVLQNRTEIAREELFPDADGSDGLSASILRLGAGMSATGPNPALGGGQYYLVVNGALLLAGVTYTSWSLVHLRPDDAPLQLRAGPEGLEVLALSFPRQQ